MIEAPVLIVVPVTLALVLALAYAAAALDAVLAARAVGARTTGGAAVPMQETARLLLQGRRTTLAPDALLWRTGGGAPLVVALLMLAVVPLGRYVPADLSVGVVWFNAMDVLLWAALWLAGWGTNSVYGLIGGYRFLAQALSYELPLMFALTGPAVAAGSLRVADVVAGQEGGWYVLQMPFAFIVFLLGVAAFSVWGPFGHPLGADAAGGLLVESSGVDRLVLLVGRYALLVAGAAFAVPLFLGGGGGPWLPDWLWSLVKTTGVLAVIVAARRRLPVLRAEQFAALGWLVLLPLTLLQVLLVSVLVLARG